MPSPKDTSGPIVKSGPTRGENRSRNKDGEWRKKRSDSGKNRDKKKSSGCFITTAACAYKGLPDNCTELQVLRDFRDKELMQTQRGSELVSEYYRIAPGIVPRLESQDFDRIWVSIKRCVKHIRNSENEAAINEYQTMVISLLNKGAGSAQQSLQPDAG